MALKIFALKYLWKKKKNKILLTDLQNSYVEFSIVACYFLLQNYYSKQFVSHKKYRKFYCVPLKIFKLPNFTSLFQNTIPQEPAQSEFLTSRSNSIIYSEYEDLMVPN